MSLSRRYCIQVLGAFSLGASNSVWAQTSMPSRLKAAAVQFQPKLGDLSTNLAKAEALAQEALGKGAKLVVLPEFFPSGLMFGPEMLRAPQAMDSAAVGMLKRLAASGGAYVGGSLLLMQAGDVYNTFVLACPDGSLLTHDKDFPTTNFESSLFAGGEDRAFVAKLAEDGASTTSEAIPPREGSSESGVLKNGALSIGSALCWELVRTRTAKRLKNQVQVVMASSGWWTIDPAGSWPGVSAAAAQSRWNDHRKLIDLAPVRLAKSLGVPVIHSNFCGANPGFNDLSFSRAASGRYLGRSGIFGADGAVLVQLDEQEGIALTDILLPAPAPAPAPTGDIPDSFWIPETPEYLAKGWAVSGAAGRNAYIKDVRKKYMAAAGKD
jgi:predicted amidohydrolase